ncbi:nucleotidyltransferase family protein [Maribellus mangrovi]|uniref:nucleotidyltransferase family protein n=1 Tax=Maribellus mangrovi TaxID=3133146 RepID=UPI0030EC6F74
MVIEELINRDKQTFYQLCNEHGVKNLFAFGSAVSNNFDTKNSDIDLLVDIDEADPLIKGEQLLSLWDKLEAFFKRKVDLLANPVIRNPYLRQSIEESKVLIYDASR